MVVYRTQIFRFRTVGVNLGGMAALGLKALRPRAALRWCNLTAQLDASGTAAPGQSREDSVACHVYYAVSQSLTDREGEASWGEIKGRRGKWGAPECVFSVSPRHTQMKVCDLILGGWMHTGTQGARDLSWQFLAD